MYAYDLTSSGISHLGATHKYIHNFEGANCPTLAILSLGVLPVHKRQNGRSRPDYIAQGSCIPSSDNRRTDRVLQQ